jgi:catechol 2,3-dioxygenase-like lactoylglutathione lyase family enzyme
MSDVSRPGMPEILLPSRRRFVAGAAIALPLLAGGFNPLAAQVLQGDELPLRTSGLEHLGVVVPDVTRSATFYTGLFGHGLFREVDPPLRYYQMMGSSYLALGSRAGADRPFLDHYCVTVYDYDREKMDARIEALGYRARPRGVALDPDGIGLQLIEYPAGLVDTNVPADRILGRGYGLVNPTGMDHVMLRVADLQASLPFYDAFFPRTPSHAPGEVWFAAADTTIRVSQQDAGKAPAFERFGIRVGPFDHGATIEGVARLGGTAWASPDPHALRIADPDGLQLEIVRV